MKITSEKWFDQNYHQSIKPYLTSQTQFLLEHRELLAIGGVYMISLYRENHIIPVYIGQASNLFRRTCQHMRNYLSNETGKIQIEHYIGVLPEELEIGVKLEIRILYKDISDEQERLRFEKYAILKYHPYTQDSSYPKLQPKNGYNEIDLCIAYEYRRKAYCNRALIPEKIDLLLQNNIDWKEASLKKKKPSTDIMKEISNIRSVEYIILKNRINKSYYKTIKPNRGCTQPFVLKLLSNAVLQYS